MQKRQNWKYLLIGVLSWESFTCVNNIAELLNAKKEFLSFMKLEGKMNEYAGHAH